MEKLLENSRNQLVICIRTRPTAFPQQHGVILRRECHCQLLLVPVEVAGGLGIQLEQRAATVGSGDCSPRHPPPKHAWQPMPQECLASFSRAHRQEQLSGGAEEEMKLQGLSHSGHSCPHPLQPLAVPQFLYVQAGMQILTTEGCSGS